jgi:MuDR family transposase
MSFLHDASNESDESDEESEVLVPTGAITDDESEDDDGDTIPQEVEVPEKVKLICLETGLPPTFPTLAEAEYQIRLSQCNSHRSFTTERNDKRRYIIKCTIDTCPFRLVVSTTMQHGTRVADGIGKHSCDVNLHVLNSTKSPAAHASFLSRYLLEKICNGTTSNKKLQETVKEELGCDVSTSTINRALNIVTDKYLYSQKSGFNLLYAYESIILERDGYVNLEVVDLDLSQTLGHRPTRATPEPEHQFYRAFFC